MPKNMNNVRELPKSDVIALERVSVARRLRSIVEFVDKTLLHGALTESGEDLASQLKLGEPANEARVAFQLANIAERNKQEIRLRAEESRRAVDPQVIERDIRGFRIMNMFAHLKMTNAVLLADHNSEEHRKEMEKKKKEKADIELFDGPSPLILLNETLNETKRTTISLARQVETKPMLLIAPDEAPDPFLEDYQSRIHAQWLKEHEASHAQSLIGVLEKTGS